MNSINERFSFVNWLRGDLGLLVILIVLSIALSIASPYFATFNNAMNILRQVAINFVVAVGMTYVILSANIDLSVGSVAALAGVVAATVIAGTGSVTTGILAGLLAGVVIGTLSGLIVVYMNVQSFIVTLAMMGIARGLALVITGGYPVSNLPETFGFFGSGYLGPVPVLAVIALLVFLIGHYVLRYTKHGLHVRAIGANEEAARLSAIKVNRYKLSVFILTGMMAALSGVLISSRLLSGQPTAATGMELDVIAAVILGGTLLSGGQGTLVGTLLGSLIIGEINNGLNLLNVSAFYQQIAKGAIILAAVMLQRRESNHK